MRAPPREEAAPSPSMTEPPEGPPEPRYRVAPVVVLMLVAATFLEVLTGSTPVPALIAHPLGIVVLLGLYGCGALLVWEAMARWEKGWLVVPPLGFAYAIVEEGIWAKTMTDAARGGPWGVYGHWLGVNWLAFISEGVAEGAFSIGLTLLLVSLIYPELKGRSLIPRWGLLPVGTAFSFVVTTGFLFSDPDPILPLLPAILLVSALALLLVVVAYRAPKGFLSPLMQAPTPMVRPRGFFLVGLVMMAGTLVVFYAGPHVIPWASLSFAIALTFPTVALLFLLRNAGWRGNQPHQVAFAAGMVAAFVPVDIILEFFGGDIGVLFFTAALLALLLWLFRRGPTSSASGLSCALLAPGLLDTVGWDRPGAPSSSGARKGVGPSSKADTKGQGPGP